MNLISEYLNLIYEYLLKYLTIVEMGRKNERTRRKTKKNTHKRRMDKIGKNTSKGARKIQREHGNAQKNKTAKRRKRTRSKRRGGRKRVTRRRRGGWGLGWLSHFGSVNNQSRCIINAQCGKDEVCASGFGGRTCHKKNKGGIKGAF